MYKIVWRVRAKEKKNWWKVISYSERSLDKNLPKSVKASTTQSFCSVNFQVFVFFLSLLLSPLFLHYSVGLCVFGSEASGYVFSFVLFWCSLSSSNSSSSSDGVSASSKTLWMKLGLACSPVYTRVVYIRYVITGYSKVFVSLLIFISTQFCVRCQLSRFEFIWCFFFFFSFFFYTFLSQQK